MLDELMTLLKSTGKETNVLETFSVKHLNYEFKHLFMEISYVQIIICLTRWFLGNWTLPKVLLSDEVVGFFVVTRYLLGIETQQANVHLILAVIKTLSDLIEEMPFINTVCYFKLSTSWQLCLLLKHQDTAINNYQPQVLIGLFRINWKSI